MRYLALGLLLPLLVACGDESLEAVSSRTQDTPRAVFEAMQRTTVDGDWDALYDLNLPSERRTCEARWERVRDDVTKLDALRRLAEEAGTDLDVLATASFRRLFVMRTAARLAGEENAGLLDVIQQARFLGVKPVEGEQDTVMARVRVGENEQDMPMKREGGQWWLYRTLTALVDL